jgi:DNA repair exonuclease SbcCD ATPase subunit
MREISRLKKYEVADYYLLGYSYEEIEAETGVSHGSIANIVQELESGKLTVAGTSLDRVSDLRQLSLDLRKKGLQPSQALLGLSLFERLRTLEITPEHLDSWAELVKRFAQPDFDPKDFFDTALRLHDLEKSQGKPFETLAEEYVRLKEGVDKLKSEIDSLSRNKEELVKEAEPLHSQLESLERTKNRLENDVEIQTRKLQELKSKTKETEEEKLRLSRETKDLQRRKTRLSSEVDSKEESLGRLNDIGLSDEDLLRITTFIERTSKNEGISGSELKKRFFSVLGLFEDISGLENRRKAETQKVSELVKKQSILRGEIAEREKKKALLEGEISGIISSTSQKVRAIGEDAASQIQQHVADIKGQLNGLLADALKAGEAIGEMRQALKKGEESEKSLDNFIKEVQSRLGRN